MKQFQFEIYDLSTLENDFKSLEEYVSENKKSTLLFHVYSGLNNEEKVLGVRDFLNVRFPSCHIAGCLSNGEIFEGHLTDPEIVVTAWIFEESLCVVKKYALEAGREETVGEMIIRDSKGAFLKGIELLTVKGEEYLNKLLDVLDGLDENVKVFGGASMGHDAVHDGGFVFSEEGEVCRNGITAVFYYGKRLHIDLEISLGWQPLGRELTITKIIGKSLEGIDNRPATEIYSHYLGLEFDEDFYKNVVEFPLILKRNGIWILREPFNENSDGGISLVSELFEGEKVRIAYADPENIVAETDKACHKIREFGPEVIMLYSCTARKNFWSYFINKEMEPFARMAPTSGFFSGGEVIRIGRKNIEQNVCLVAAGFREGERKISALTEVHVDKSMLHGQLSILRRLATFARATTEELENANRKLREYAVIDELTKVFNRRELERRLMETLRNSIEFGNDASFIMLDIDYFKKINDRYGHASGDVVLREVSEILKDHAQICGNEYGDAAVGRFGGEEFIIVLPGISKDRAVDIAESIRSDIEQHKFPESIKVTASLGVTSINDADRNMRDIISVSKRVDRALYKAKNDGRNCVRVEI